MTILQVRVVQPSAVNLTDWQRDVIAKDNLPPYVIPVPEYQMLAKSGPEYDAIPKGATFHMQVIFGELK